MNKIKGTVSELTSSGELTLVKIQVGNDFLSAVIIEDSSSHLEIGKEVIVIFKETEVALAVEFSGRISLRNKLCCKVTAIEKGIVLTSVKLDYKGNNFTSIITTSSAESLDLKPDLIVTAFVKTNELMLMEA